MKTLFATIAFAISGAILSVLAQAPANITNENTDKKAVELRVVAFIKAGDESNRKALEQLMHPNYRALAHLPGSNAATPVIESREQYLQLISEGKIGGKPRTIAIRSVELWNNTAIVRAELESATLHFSSTFSLFYSAETGWQLVHDLVELQARGKEK